MMAGSVGAGGCDSPRPPDCIFGARGSTTITLCAGRAGTPSRSPVQLRNDGLMPWLSVTGTPTSATPWRCSASVRTARQRFPLRTDARRGARV